MILLVHSRCTGSDLCNFYANSLWMFNQYQLCIFNELSPPAFGYFYYLYRLLTKKLSLFFAVELDLVVAVWNSGRKVQFSHTGVGILLLWYQLMLLSLL